MKKLFILLVIISLISCTGKDSKKENNIRNSGMEDMVPSLDLSEANRLADLPIECVTREYPNKLNQVITGDQDLLSPGELHPAFFGCFDWHSSVHGHWSLVKLAKTFPELEKGTL